MTFETISPETIRRVQASWAKLRPIAPEAATIFYDTLFARDPSLRALFPEDLSGQKTKLMSALTMAVGWLDRPGTVAPMLEDLGEKHVAYGVEPADYATAGFALIDTLAACLGEDFDAATEAAWKDVLSLVAATMLHGARHAYAEVAQAA